MVSIIEKVLLEKSHTYLINFYELDRFKIILIVMSSLSMASDSTHTIVC